MSKGVTQVIALLSAFSNYSNSSLSHIKVVRNFDQTNKPSLHIYTMMLHCRQGSRCLRNLFVIIVVGGVAAQVFARHNELDLNERPIIGILTQEYIGKPWDQIPYIAASYVKFVESGGARVVPVHINRDREYYENIVSQLNGVLFPGGDADVHDSGYGRAGRLIYEYAREHNKANDYFPLWGTCNGFEMLVYLSVDDYVLKRCDSKNQAQPLLSLQTVGSRLFGSGMTPDVADYLTNMNTTVNFHEWCLTPENFTERGVNRMYNSLAEGKDNKDLRFIAAIEAKAFPFYGVQFHPEKTLFEWTIKQSCENIPHTSEATRVSQYFAEFFVNEARKSKHRMSEDQFSREAIYNNAPQYTQNQSVFTQIYFFN
ncbi:gamma-glutamyl hydrolase-like [Tropilaelaps mercedesae]|uniref:folate gamma-glutamyl hydrolase n=1 Tax=Tropilaelaps mercedesae TaxID=418985 RepID=A0A1V9XY46_9ACAR|nr:gamma-glutamyl hydrolase-like [Tropilaelaps mercedesae]